MDGSHAQVNGDGFGLLPLKISRTCKQYAEQKEQGICGSTERYPQSHSPKEGVRLGGVSDSESLFRPALSAVCLHTEINKIHLPYFTITLIKSSA